MTEQPQYTGAQYEQAFYKQPNESLFDYMQRLAQLRSTGILGGGGMLDATAPNVAQNASPAVSAVPLGEVRLNPSVSDSSENQLNNRPASKQEQYNSMRMLMDNPIIPAVMRQAIPMGLGNLFLRDSQIEANVRNAQNEATGHQGFFDYLFGREGDQVLGERGASGSLVTGKASDMPYSATNPYSDGGYFDQLMNEARQNIMGGATAYPADPAYPNFNKQTMARQVQMIEAAQREAELAAAIAAEERAMTRNYGTDSYSSGGDASSASRQSSKLDAGTGSGIGSGGGNASRGFSTGGW